MPPFGSRNHEHSSSPPSAPASRSKTQRSSAPRTKLTLFESVDAPASDGKSLEDNRRFLNSLHGVGSDRDDSDDDSSLSEADTDEFEDVPPAKRQRTSPAHDKYAASDDGEEGEAGEDEDEDEDEMDWEDAIHHDTNPSPSRPLNHAPDDIADVSISLNEDGSSYVEPLVSAATIKKGPSKRERQIRIQTHCLHVQALMWHNTVRNSWCNDAEVQKILVNGLPSGLRKGVDHWKASMGMSSGKELERKRLEAVEAATKRRKGNTSSLKRKVQGSGRDWTYDAGHAESDAVNMSGGDPVLRLLKVLTAYWRKRFAITAPCLRKQGYKPLRRLRDDMKAWEKNRDNAEESGERIENLAQFRKLAKECEGSRDVGTQLFVALLRGIGLETRLVASLQPAGFGWSKTEEADPKLKRKQTVETTRSNEEESDAPDTTAVGVARDPSKPAQAPRPADPSKRKSTRGNQANPINLDDSDSDLSSAPSNLDGEIQNEAKDDVASVIEISPSPTPTRKRVKQKFDRDLKYPSYWGEVCSPATNKYYPVDPIVLSTIASNDELLQTFEPRGKPAEQTKQVICYTIGFSPDGTAKDLTIRYLKRHQLPGKTKGMRMPAEKIPVYNHEGKVKRYEEYDWFRTVMSLYDRPEAKRTTADDLEEQTDLKPFKPSQEKKEVDKESLQWYKQSAEFVLKQHLRREEALQPRAKVVKVFTAGKGDKAKSHDVYRRADVLSCKTVESWHKEGRAVAIGEQPIKYVPMRAVTLVRKREMEDTQRETGEKAKQGLYSREQTEWIIPPPIVDGVIPKNAFGNMDVYVPTMVPTGAVHLPLKGSAKICKRLGIDFAEACTGFEFGKQRAVPVLTGVVVAEENERLLRDAWRADQAEQKRKQDTKRAAIALRWWRKMVLGLRVLERVHIEFAEKGGTEEEVNPFVAKAQREGRMGVESPVVDPEDEAGGFVKDDAQAGRSQIKGHEGSDIAHGGGLLVEEGADHDHDTGGGFLLVDEDEDVPSDAVESRILPFTPIALQRARQEYQEQPVDTNSDTNLDLSENFSSRQQTSKVPRHRRSTGVDEQDGMDSSSISSVEIQPPPPPALNDSGFKKMSSRRSKQTSSTRKTRLSADKPALARPSGLRVAGRHANTTMNNATPRKSRYFHSEKSMLEDQSDGSEDDGGDSESEHEVVTPRRTTARTRARKSD